MKVELRGRGRLSPETTEGLTGRLWITKNILALLSEGLTLWLLPKSKWLLWLCSTSKHTILLRLCSTSSKCTVLLGLYSTSEATALLRLCNASKSTALLGLCNIRETTALLRLSKRWLRWSAKRAAEIVLSEGWSSWSCCTGRTKVKAVGCRLLLCTKCARGCGLFATRVIKSAATCRGLGHTEHAYVGRGCTGGNIK